MKSQILPLVIWPDERLKKVAEPVTEFNPELNDLIRDMYVTMKANNGIGLAAPQVGVSKRLFILEIEQDKALVFINPEILDASADQLYKIEEGCLSVPGYFEERERPRRIVVRFQEVTGATRELELLGIYAFAFQHELDHLNGVSFVDDASLLKRERIKNKIKKTLQIINSRA